MIAVPDPRAIRARNLINAHQTVKAYRRQVVGFVSFALNLERVRAGLDRRQVESPIQQRELVVDGQLGAAKDASDQAGVVERKTAENEGPRFVPGSIPVVLHLDVVRVNQVLWEQSLEYGVVGAMGEWLHVNRSATFARRGVIVLQAIPEGSAVGAGFVTETRRLFSAAFLVLSPGGGFLNGKRGRFLPDGAFATPTGADLRDEVVPFFGPKVLPALLICPASTSAGAS